MQSSRAGCFIHSSYKSHHRRPPPPPTTAAVQNVVEHRPGFSYPRGPAKLFSTFTQGTVWLPPTPERVRREWNHDHDGNKKQLLPSRYFYSASNNALEQRDYRGDGQCTYANRRFCDQGRRPPQVVRCGAPATPFSHRLVERICGK